MMYIVSIDYDQDVQLAVFPLLLYRKQKKKDLFSILIFIIK